MNIIIYNIIIIKYIYIIVVRILPTSKRNGKKLQAKKPAKKPNQSGVENDLSKMAPLSNQTTIWDTF